METTEKGQCSATRRTNDFTSLRTDTLPELHLPKRSKRQKALPRRLIEDLTAATTCDILTDDAYVNQPVLPGLRRQISVKRHGLVNSRNNCWLNSTLQVFTALPRLFDPGKYYYIKLNCGGGRMESYFWRKDNVGKCYLCLIFLDIVLYYYLLFSSSVVGIF